MPQTLFFAASYWQTLRGVFRERVAGRIGAAVHRATGRESSDDDLPGRVSDVIESPSSFGLMNGTFGIDCLLRPFRAFWSCASQPQGDALG